MTQRYTHKKCKLSLHGSYSQNDALGKSTGKRKDGLTMKRHCACMIKSYYAILYAIVS